MKSRENKREVLTNSLVYNFKVITDGVLELKKKTVYFEVMKVIENTSIL